MTNLQDIQENTSKFNIAFHLQNCIGEAMMQVFMFEDNKDKIEAALKIKSSPYDVRSFMIAQMFGDFVNAYLSESFDGVEGEE